MPNVDYLLKNGDIVFVRSEKSCELLCKVCILEETLGDFEFRYALEVYNHGNQVAERVKIVINGESITVADFIKPNESFVYPLGNIGQMIGCNRVWPDQGEELQQGEPLIVQLEISGDAHNYEVNTDLLYAYRGVVNGTLNEVSTAIQKNSDQIKKSFDSVISQLSSMKKEVEKISKH